MTTNASPVLLYHEVDEPTRAKLPAYNVSPHAFRRQLEQLLTQGFELVTVTQLVQRLRSGESPERLAAVSFDDGFRSFLDQALDVLVDLGVPATIYIPTRWTGQVPGWLTDGTGPTIMSEDEITALAGTHIEIGGHTHSHLHLDLLRSNQICTEIAHNKAELESLTGTEVTSFAYPHGSHDHRARRLVRECGYHNACVVKGAPLTKDGDEFRIGRIVVTEDDDLTDVAPHHARLTRQYPNGRTSVGTAAARHAYRATRRMRLHRHHQALLASS